LVLSHYTLSWKTNVEELCHSLDIIDVKPGRTSFATLHTLICQDFDYIGGTLIAQSKGGFFFFFFAHSKRYNQVRHAKEEPDIAPTASRFVK
jgi:hypothetical protein